MTKKFIDTNLGNVIRFEIIRNLKKPTFWIAALILPVLLVGYIAFAGFVGYNANLTAEGGTDTEKLNLGLYDAADYLTTNVIPQPDNTTQEVKLFDSKEQGIDAVKNDEISVFYYIPANFDEILTAEIYAKSASFNIFANYETPLRTLLMLSAATRIDPTDLAVVTNVITIDTTNFTVDNTEVDLVAEISRMIIPGLALVLFYILIVSFGNRLTTAMVEEKENRISEMILTSLKPRDLITGKIISLIILGFIQLAILIIPIVVLTIFGFSNNIIPSDFVIDFNFWTVLSTLILLLASFFLFTALCVTIGVLVPTAKDASQFAGIVIILTILPLFFINSFMSANSADSMTYFLSYFPPSAPIALMFRNVFGTLPINEYFIGLIIIFISSYFVIKFSVYVYSRTAIEFTSRVNLKKLFSSPRKNWKK
ncbi:ABC transporter permease [Candidatus Saccharibacteria bacterium]|nr:ABC transporter permease [Candidatus Saccharibacteria bacterium]